MTTCNACPYRLISLEGSDTCPFCAKGFYQKSSTALPEEIFQNPSENCLKCPLGTYDSSESGASSINDCVSCNPGTFSDKAGKNRKLFMFVIIVIFNCFVTSNYCCM